MDYTNTRDNDISYFGTSTSHHMKVDTPGTKPDTTGAVLDAKGAANKKNTVTQDKRKKQLLIKHRRERTNQTLHQVHVPLIVHRNYHQPKIK